jgi:nucleoside diphosphate kinase
MPLPLAIPLAMAGAGLVGQIFGGIKSGKANKEAAGVVDKQVSDLTSWYDTEKNKDFLQSNLASSAMNKALESIEDRNKTIESSSAITGASDAAKLAAKGQSQKEFSSTVKDLAAYGTAREDRIEGRYRANLGNLMGQKVNILQGKAQNAANLGKSGGDLISAAGGLTGMTKWGGVTDSANLGVRNKFGRTASQETSMQDIASSAFNQ